jgi:hypothetical protein
MKITTVIASVLALFATSAAAMDGDCALQRSAAAVVDRQQTTASSEQPAPRSEESTLVAQDTTTPQTKIVVTE